MAACAGLAAALLSAGCANRQPATPAPAESAQTPATPANTGNVAANAKAPAKPLDIARRPFDPFAVEALAERPADDGWTGLGAAPNQGEPGPLPRENPTSAMIDGMEGLTQATFAAEGADFDPRLSKCGTWLVFASTQHRTTPDIYIKKVGSRTVTQLTADPASDVMPALSPDAKRIAFSSNRNGWWNLYLISIGGGQAVQLSTQAAHELHPTWSPDGQRLAFCRLGQVSGRWEVWVLEVDRPQVAEFIGYGMFPEWNPVAATGFDGSDKILFQRSRERGDRAFGLWTIDYKPGFAGSPTEVVSVPGQAAINATWGPDGRWIAYSTVPVNALSTPGAAPAGRPAAADLWIASVEGTGRVNLTGGRFTNVMATWGADGRIYFVSDRAGVDNVWSVATDRALAAAGGGAGSGHASASGGAAGMNGSKGERPATAEASDHPAGEH
jgi:TolB protein